jgi:hypothetical protein
MRAIVLTVSDLPVDDRPAGLAPTQVAVSHEVVEFSPRRFGRDPEDVRDVRRRHDRPIDRVEHVQYVVLVDFRRELAVLVADALAPALAVPSLAAATSLLASAVSSPFSSLPTVLPAPFLAAVAVGSVARCHTC